MSPQCVDMRKVGGLLAFHGGDQHFVQYNQFFRILLLIRFDSLGHKILRYNLLNFGCMFFLVEYPAHQLIGVCGFGPALFHYLFHRLFNGRGVFGDQLRSQLVIVNPTWNLTMGTCICYGE